MINSVILLGAFDCDHVTDIFYYANDLLFSHAVGTNGTNGTIGHIKTTLTEFYFATHLADHFTELSYLAIILPEKVQYPAQGGFFTNAGKFSTFINCIFPK